MKISVVCENTVNVPVPKGLIGEHGLSFLIEGETHTLFDTGQGAGVVNNLKLLGKDINSIKRIIISHGHYDHTGGLISVLDGRQEGAPVYLHPDAFVKKIALVELPQANIEIPIGFPLAREDYEKAGAEFRHVRGFAKIDEGLFSISDVERPSGWKTWDARLKQKERDAITDDPFNDDLSLLVETDSGPVVLLGCAHAGIVEILQDLSSKSGHKEFHAVIGGTHLGSADGRYIEKAVDMLKQYNVKVVATSHCTGFHAARAVAAKMNSSFKTAFVGDSFDF